MQYLLDAYAAAEEGFNAKPENPKSDSVTYGAQGDFARAFARAADFLKRQAGAAKREADKTIITQNVGHLVDITSVFFKRLPVYPWDAPELESVITHDVLSEPQKETLCDAFTYAMVRDVKADPACLEYRFLNSHQFKKGGKVLDLFTKVITENFEAMFAQDQQLTMTYAVQMAHLANKQEERQRFVDLFVEYASKYDRPYSGMDGEGDFGDPFLLMAMWSTGTKYEKQAFKLLERRVANLAVSAKKHARINRNTNPHVLVISDPDLDDLHFYAFDAIFHIANAGRRSEGAALKFMSLAKKLFVRHFDPLAEINPSKGFVFAFKLFHELNYRGSDGSKLRKSAEKFRQDIVGLVASSLLGKVNTVKIRYQHRNVIEDILEMTKDGSITDMVVDHVIGKAKESKVFSEQTIDTLLTACAYVGQQHPKFNEMADMILKFETLNPGQSPGLAAANLLNLVGRMGDENERRLPALQAAATFAEILMHQDPESAEKHLKNIVERCRTPEEKNLGRSIKRRLLPRVSSVTPTLDEDVARMKSIVRRYTI